MHVLSALRAKACVCKLRPHDACLQRCVPGVCTQLIYPSPRAVNAEHTQCPCRLGVARGCARCVHGLARLYPMKREVGATGSTLLL